jgi:hypothetical protein
MSLVMENLHAGEHHEAGGNSVPLRYATLPFSLGLFAVHYWFLVFGPGSACHRGEVWQTKNAGGMSIGHVHRPNIRKQSDLVIQPSSRSLWHSAGVHIRC